MRRLQLKGKKINHLLVLGYSRSYIQPSGQKRALWRVKCDCGVIKEMSTSTLMHGLTVSCGHVGIQIRKNGINKRPFGLANLNYKYLSYKSRAKYMKVNFNLSREEFKEIIDKNCYYCDGIPELHHTKRSYNGLYISNGIDRIDSKKGYILKNAVPCCQKCNVMKNKYPTEEFISHIKKIYHYVTS